MLFVDVFWWGVLGEFFILSLFIVSCMDLLIVLSHLFSLLSVFFPLCLQVCRFNVYVTV